MPDFVTYKLNKVVHKFLLYKILPLPKKNMPMSIAIKNIT